jgi:hypothetical protein
MERKLTRAVAVITAAAAVALAGVGDAAARGLDGGTGGPATGTTVTVRSTAAELQALHDELRSSADAGDVAAVQSTLGEVDTALTRVVGGERAIYRASSVRLATTAKQETADAAKAVAELPTPAARDLPPVAGLLNALLQRLLLSLSSLVNDLLGGLGPVPVP